MNALFREKHQPPLTVANSPKEIRLIDLSFMKIFSSSNVVPVLSRYYIKLGNDNEPSI